MTTFAGTNHSNETLIPSHTSTSENHCISSSRRALSYLKSSFRADESTTDPSFVAHRDHRAANPHTTFVTASDPTFYTPSNSTNTNPSRCNDFIETRTDPSFTALKMGRRTGGNAYVETHTDPSFTALQMELRKGGSVETRSDPTFAMARAHREAHPNRRVESRTDPSFTMVQGGRGFNC